MGTTAEMYPLKPLGKDTICKYMKQITFKLGLEDQEKFGWQALRTYMATKLANDKSVSIEESMAALRHALVGAYCA